MTNQCEHGTLKRSCEICQRDEEIAALKHDLKNAIDGRNKEAQEVERLRERIFITYEALTGKHRSTMGMT